MAWKLSAFADEAGSAIDQQIAALKRDGLRYIDLRNLDGFSIVDLPVDHARTVKEKLDEAGITVGMYGSPIGKIDIADELEIDLGRLEHLAELKPIFGATNVRMFSFYNKKEDWPAEKFKAEAVDRLHRLAEKAASLGLVLYHENEMGIFGQSVADNIVIRDQVRAKHPEHLKMIFDFANYQHAGDDCWEGWLELRDTTDAIHLKEVKFTNPQKTQDVHVPVGTGDGDVKRILADAAERGWDGPLTLEPHLKFSKAVLATGPTGQTNQAYADMDEAESFHAAAEAAVQRLREVGKWDA